MSDGLPLPEFSSKSSAPCPHCIMEYVYVGHGDYTEHYECYCQEVHEPFAPGFPEIINEER